MATPLIKRPIPSPRRLINSPTSTQPGNEIDLKMKQQLFKFCDSISSKRTKRNSDVKTQIPNQEADLLLIGKTGNGKSAVGNSILGKTVFKSASSLSSVTKNIALDWCVFNHVKLKVVDGPGVGDTRLDNEQAVDLVLNAISSAIAVNPQGYHAFLLVLKYGSRLTAEDQDTITFLKKVFGEMFFNKFCIIIMTNGDLFKTYEKVTFEEWIADQNCGIFQQMLKECNRRIILFDNTSQDTATKQDQLNDLLKLIEKVKSENCRYAGEHFKSAHDARDALIVEAEKEIISEDIMSEANLIYFSFQDIINKIEPYFRAKDLEELTKRAKALQREIERKDKGTQVLQSLLKHVESLIFAIANEITLSNKLAEERDKFEKQIREEAMWYEAQLQKQRDEFNAIQRHEEEKAVFLANQVSAMKSKEELWKETVNEFHTKLKAKSSLENKEIQVVGAELRKLKDIQVEKMKEKRKGNIFVKMKEAIKRK